MIGLMQYEDDKITVLRHYDQRIAVIERSLAIADSALPSPPA
jgi:hypothetical protein